jgi:glutamate racemase
MMKKPIGVIDSGIGGLTVVASMQKLMPGEDIIYLGDSKNVPYGNKSEEDIYLLTMAMLKFLEEREVKLAAIACNTISTIHKRFNGKLHFPVVDIVTPTVDHIDKMGAERLAILATEFTVKMGSYERMLRERRPGIEVFNEGSRDLATLIDRGEFDSQATYDIVKHHLNSIKGKGEVYNIVLACTHYPIVEEIFLDIDPSLNYINPGFQQAKAIRAQLHDMELLQRDGLGSVEIYTSGEAGIYRKAAEKLGIKRMSEPKTVAIKEYTE